MTSRIEWRRTARHPGRLFTREFEQEEIADIGLILDARHGSDIRWVKTASSSTRSRATASLSEMFLQIRQPRQPPRPGHRPRGDRAVWILKNPSLNRILCVLARARPGSADESLSLDRVPLRLLGSRALIVIVSPLDSFDRPISRASARRETTGLARLSRPHCLQERPAASRTICRSARGASCSDSTPAGAARHCPTRHFRDRLAG